MWLDDIIGVTRGTKEEHTKKLESVLTKLENEGYKASKNKSKFYIKETVWLGHTIAQDGIRPNKQKTEAINKLNAPTNTKTLKSFSGAIQYFAKFIPNLSEKTDNMRQLLKKGTKWEWTEERNTDFNNIKRELTSQPCLAHYNGNKKNRHHRCLRYRTRNSIVAETKQRRPKTNSLCKLLPKRRRKNIQSEN